MTQNENLKQAAYVSLAALGGVAIGLLAGKTKLGSENWLLRFQNGHRKGELPSDIMEHDKKVFQGEVLRH